MAEKDNTGGVGGEYAALLAELDGLQKSFPVPDDKGGAESEEDKEKRLAAEAAAAAKGGKDGEGDEEPFGKSFGVTLEDGTRVDAFDGTAMMKSLNADITGLKAQVVTLESQNATLLKALQVSVATSKQRDELFKSLQADVARIGGTGAGRRTSLSVHDKLPPGGTPATDQMNAADFMAKSNAAFSAGRISGQDLTVIDVSLRTNAAVDPGLIAKVLA